MLSRTKLSSHNLAPNIVRAYDIRGIYGKDLHDIDAYHIGRAFASILKNKHGVRSLIVSIARDGRLSSPALERELALGLIEGGANVIKVGIGPSPMLYYSVHKMKCDAGIMITASHNPGQYNGFKFMISGVSLDERDIAEIGEVVRAGEYSQGSGNITENNEIFQYYVENLLSALSQNNSLRIAWDAGNGAAGDVMSELCRSISGEHFVMHEKIDGNFPNHHPDPSVPENMQDLIDIVLSKKCDVGIAFDGDGDRIGVCDENGRMLYGDELMAIYAAAILQENKGATIIADVKASSRLFDEISRLGGKAVMWKTGNTLIKSKMKQEKAAFAGEMSGHMFFADHYFGFDDGLYAAIRLINILAKSNETLSQLVAKLPPAFSTPEIKFSVPDEKKFAVMDRIINKVKAKYQNVIDIDGVRVNEKDGWWLIRASNTSGAITARAEANSQQRVAEMQKMIQEIVESEI